MARNYELKMMNCRSPAYSYALNTYFSVSITNAPRFPAGVSQ